MMHVIATEVKLNATGPDQHNLERRLTMTALIVIVYWASNHAKFK